jgi:hypothetical protein
MSSTDAAAAYLVRRFWPDASAITASPSRKLSEVSYRIDGGGRSLSPPEGDRSSLSGCRDGQR